MEEEVLGYKLGSCIQLKLKLGATLPYFDQSSVTSNLC